METKSAVVAFLLQLLVGLLAICVFELVTQQNLNAVTKKKVKI